MSPPLPPLWTLGDFLHSIRHRLQLVPSEANRAEMEERVGYPESWHWRNYLGGLSVQDLRDEHRGNRHRRGRPRAPRQWSEIFGVTVHQSASGRLDENHPGLLSIPAHIMVHQSGAVTLLHPLALRMPHGHALNGPTIGIEVDCRAYGVVDDPRTFWRRKSEKERGQRPEQLAVPPTHTQLRSLEKVLDYCRGALEAHGRPCKVYTHRQGHKSRVSDPGERIAKVLVGWARAHGETPPYDETFGSGKPWPYEWRAAA